MTTRQDTITPPAPPMRGHRWFAARYETIIGPAERRLFSKVRPRLLVDLSGDVLEVGAGTGMNFESYPIGVRVVATEPDSFMLQRAFDRRSGAAANIELREASAEELPFDDASFDHVVATLVFCTVPNAGRGLAEIRRVLRPGGTFRFLEHVRNDDSRIWGSVQDLVAPAWRWFGAGCNPNRRTERAIRNAGFRFEWIERRTMGFGAPAIYGVARHGGS